MKASVFIWKLQQSILPTCCKQRANCAVICRTTEENLMKLNLKWHLVWNVHQSTPIKPLSVSSLQDSLDATAFPAPAITSTAVWVTTAWPTLRRVKGSVNAWTTANLTTSLCAVPTGSCTRTTASFIGPHASAGAGLPSCTARSVSTRVRRSLASWPGLDEWF